MLDGSGVLPTGDFGDVGMYSMNTDMSTTINWYSRAPCNQGGSMNKIFTKLMFPNKIEILPTK